MNRVRGGTTWSTSVSVPYLQQKNSHQWTRHPATNIVVTGVMLPATHVGLRAAQGQYSAPDGEMSGRRQSFRCSVNPTLCPQEEVRRRLEAAKLGGQLRARVQVVNPPWILLVNADQICFDLQHKFISASHLTLPRDCSWAHSSVNPTCIFECIQIQTARTDMYTEYHSYEQRSTQARGCTGAGNVREVCRSNINLPYLCKHHHGETVICQLSLHCGLFATANSTASGGFAWPSILFRELC